MIKRLVYFVAAHIAGWLAGVLDAVRIWYSRRR